MKATVTCELLEKLEVGKPAVVKRTSNHPVLGEPKPGRTVTSKVIGVNHEECFFETENTLYKF